jgi:hypothetical protein
MRESQMKKIIALAVASAFVAPAFAADVSVSGDVEYMYVDQNSGSSFNSGDQDIVVSASEEIGNGLTATYSNELDGDSDDTGVQSDSELTIAGAGFSVKIGDATAAAIEVFDEKSDKAEQGGTSGENVISTEHSLLLQFSPMANLEVAVSTGTVNDAADATSYAVSSYAVQYTMGGVSVAYGSADTEEAGKATQSSISVGYSNGPISIGYESISNVSYTDKDDQSNLGVAYNYGNGSIFIEDGEVKDDSASSKTEKTAIGASYKLGAVNLYALRNTVATTGSADDDQTYVGVEYAF